MLTEAPYGVATDRQRREPDVVEPVLALLADPDHEGEVGGRLRRMAAALADQRDTAALERFLAGALSTGEVIERVRSWSDRRTPASARRRRQLHGLTIGRATYHPDGQFTRSGRRHDLGAVIGPLVDAAAGDPVLADQIMRAPRSELEGRSLVDLLAGHRTAEVQSAGATNRHSPQIAGPGAAPGVTTIQSARWLPRLREVRTAIMRPVVRWLVGLDDFALRCR